VNKKNQKQNILVDEDVTEKLNNIINQIRKNVQSDGGDLELVSFKNGIVSVRFHGACVGCPMAMVTFSDYIEKSIKDQIPKIKEVKLI